MLKTILRIIGLLILILLAVILFRTFRPGVPQPQAAEIPHQQLPDSAVKHFQEALQIRTISFGDTFPVEAAAFGQLQKLLGRAYPLMEAQLEKTVINGYSLLYKWKGKDSSLSPIVLMGHMDVVPVGADSAKWDLPPFSAQFKDSILYARGTLDDKIAVISILESAEKLLKEHYVPERTIYFAFGHDEEVGGTGATAISAYLAGRHIRAAYILDEGLAVTQGIISGIDKPVALIGTAEKGAVSVKLTVNIHGGHSSQPEKNNAIALLAKAIDRLEENQMQAQFTPAFAQMSDVLSPEMPFLNRMALCNRWLFKPLVFGMMEKSPSLNAAIRTTTAPTLFHSGIKENILPEEAYAVVNFRILPGNTIQDVLAHVKKVVNDSNIQIEKVGYGEEPSPSSPTDSADFRLLSRTVKSIFPQAIVSPGLVIGATDSRHYYAVSKHIYRFSPITVNSEDVKRIHGINERIPVSQYADAFNFYYYLMRYSGSRRW